MSSVLPFPGVALAAPAAAAPTDEQAQRFQARCFEAYLNFTVSRGLTETYSAR